MLLRSGWTALPDSWSPDLLLRVLHRLDIPLADRRLEQPMVVLRLVGVSDREAAHGESPHVELPPVNAVTRPMTMSQSGGCTSRSP